MDNLIYEKYENGKLLDKDEILKIIIDELGGYQPAYYLNWILDADTKCFKGIEIKIKPMEDEEE